MRSESHLAVGSPTVRVAAVMLATLLLAVALAAAGVAGQRLLAASAPIVVDQSGGGDYATITEAIAAAQDGDTILIRPGKYPETLAVVGKNLDISGEGDRKDIVLERTYPPTDDPWVVLLSSTATRLANLTLMGPYDGVAVSVEGVGTAATLEELTIEVPDPVDMDYWGLAVYWDEGTSGVVRDSLIEGTVSVGAAARVTIEENEMPASCIDSERATGAAIVIRGNAISGCPSELAVAVDASNDVLIEGNDIMAEDLQWPTDYYLSLGRVGIRVAGEGPGNVTIRDNDIHDSRFGIEFGSPDTPTESLVPSTFNVYRNRLRDNDMGLARVVGSTGIDGPTVSIVGNTIEGSAQIGIELRRGAATLEDNTITNNVVGLSLTADAAPALADNTICDNATNLKLPADAEPPELTDNEVCADEPAA